MDPESLKRHAARAALEFLPEAGIIGLGTGSTTRYFIEGIGELVKKGRSFVGVPTSDQSRKLASACGIPLLGDDGPWDVLLCVDGADEVSDSLDLIKGGGGAHTREKIVNFASRRNVIIVDESKLSRHLGQRRAVPVEVLPFAHYQTAHLIGALGKPELRHQGGSVLRTDSGNYIYDLECGPIADPRALDATLKSIPGVVETGLFCGRTDAVVVARGAEIEVLHRRDRDPAATG